MVVKGLLKTALLGIPLLGVFYLGNSCSIPIRHDYCIRNSPTLKNQSQLEERISEIREDLSIPGYFKISGKINDNLGTSISRKVGFENEYLIEISRRRSECSLVHELCHVKKRHHDRKGDVILSELKYPFLRFFETFHELEAIRCQEKYYRAQRKQ